MGFGLGFFLPFDLLTRLQISGETFSGSATVKVILFLFPK